MGKIKNTALFLLLAYMLPLAMRPSLLLDYRILFLMLAAVTVFLTQPGFEVEEAERDRTADNNSVLFILVLSVLAIAVPVIEWGYFHPGRAHLHWIVVGGVIVTAGTGLRIWGDTNPGALFHRYRTNPGRTPTNPAWPLPLHPPSELHGSLADCRRRRYRTGVLVWAADRCRLYAVCLLCADHG
jgi:hypothetical protein